MRILVVGAGATGGYFGGRLAEAGRDVTFLVRPARAERLRADGLRIVSPHGDFRLAPKIVVAGEIKQTYDIVLITVKGFALDAALEDVAPAVGEDTMVMAVLNGVRHVDKIIARFGEKALVGCVCKVATTLDQHGYIVQLLKFQELAYGEINGVASARTGLLDEFMKNAGFDARLTPVIEREMWEKWMLLASMGGITCLMRGTIGQVEAVPGGGEFALAVMAECVEIATAAGHAPSAEFLNGTAKMLTTKGSVQASSMYRDLQKGAPVEAEPIIGDFLVRAHRLGVKAPLLGAAFIHLQVYQNSLAGK